MFYLAGFKKVYFKTTWREGACISVRPFWTTTNATPPSAGPLQRRSTLGWMEAAIPNVNKTESGSQQYSPNYSTWTSSEQVLCLHTCWSMSPHFKHSINTAISVCLTTRVLFFSKGCSQIYNRLEVTAGWKPMGPLKKTREENCSYSLTSGDGGTTYFYQFVPLTVTHLLCIFFCSNKTAFWGI